MALDTGGMYDEKLNFREFITHGPRKCEDWEVVNLYHHHPHLSVREIAKQSHRSIGEVYRIIQRNGGYANRLSPDHDSVRLYADAGLSQKDIGERLNYSDRHVRRILNGR